LAKKYNSRLHVLHLTTAEEMLHFDNTIPLEEKRITAEVCAHNLFFSRKDYADKGSRIKCNPAIKEEIYSLKLLECVDNDSI
ncbi:dihydroorotase, partial [Francisella tularensis subsp. holarctica]|nr:dihydroorotase [Francisella tularensis subsp. holarctica]